MDTTSSPTIRRARPDEAAALSALALRSKGHWGYDAAFLDTCRADLTLTPAEIDRDAVYVIAAGSDPPRGFYQVQEAGASHDAGQVQEPGASHDAGRLRAAAADLILNALFVEPGTIGRGYGRQLFAHAVALATARGAHGLIWTSDPYAAGFYRALGARLVGATPSTIFPDRLLPTFHLALPAPVDLSPACSSPH